MSKRVNTEEISAYLDGEARESGRVRDAIAQDPAAAAEYQRLARLSERIKTLPAPEVHASFADRVVASIESTCPEQTAIARLVGRLRALPEPEVHPGFARRVIAAIESGEGARTIGWAMPARATAFAAVAIALIAGLTVFVPSNETTTERPAVATSTVEPDPVIPDESVLLANFDARVAADAEIQRIVTTRFETQPQPEDIYSDRLLAAFTGSTGAAAGEAFAHGADYRAALRHFDREQTNALKDLLEASVREAREG